MIRLLLPLALLLSACGVDGAPTRPEPKDPPRTGVFLSGTVGVGVTGGSTRIDYSGN